MKCSYSKTKANPQFGLLQTLLEQELKKMAKKNHLGCFGWDLQFDPKITKSFPGFIKACRRTKGYNWNPLLSMERLCLSRSFMFLAAMQRCLANPSFRPRPRMREGLASYSQMLAAALCVAQCWPRCGVAQCRCCTLSRPRHQERAARAASQ